MQSVGDISDGLAGTYIFSDHVRTKKIKADIEGGTEAVLVPDVDEVRKQLLRNRSLARNSRGLHRVLVQLVVLGQGDRLFPSVVFLQRMNNCLSNSGLCPSNSLTL